MSIPFSCWNLIENNVFAVEGLTSVCTKQYDGMHKPGLRMDIMMHNHIINILHAVPKNISLKQELKPN